MSGPSGLLLSSQLHLIIPTWSRRPRRLGHRSRCLVPMLSWPRAQLRPCSLCMPARAGDMTRRYPRRGAMRSSPSGASSAWRSGRWDPPSSAPARMCATGYWPQVQTWRPIYSPSSRRPWRPPGTCGSSMRGDPSTSRTSARVHRPTTKRLIGRSRPRRSSPSCAAKGSSYRSSQRSSTRCSRPTGGAVSRSQAGCPRLSCSSVRACRASSWRSRGSSTRRSWPSISS